MFNLLKIYPGTYILTSSDVVDVEHARSRRRPTAYHKPMLSYSPVFADHDAVSGLPFRPEMLEIAKLQKTSMTSWPFVSPAPFLISA